MQFWFVGNWNSFGGAYRSTQNRIASKL